MFVTPMPAGSYNHPAPRVRLPQNWESTPARAHAREPLVGAVELLGAGQGLGALPDAVEGADAGAADDLVAESLAATVLGELHLEAEQARDDLVEQTAALPVAIEAPAKVGVGRVELIADRIHHVLCVA